MAAPAEARRFAVVPQLDIKQILKEAQQRWLRPAEICEILKNYRNFRIDPEPPNTPPSGSLFLFDRKVLRYFRKDGHNWRKKKDGKTVKEAHERLKSGSVDVLHCYYAHGEENENFQRRTYWMLEEDFMHIVLVHYLETKGGKSSRARGNNDMLQAAAVDSPLSQLPSQTIEGESSLSGQASEYEEAESDTYSGGAGYYSFTQMQQHQNGIGPVIDASIFSSYAPASSIGNYQGLQHAMAHNTSSYSSDQDNSPVVLNDSSLGLGTNGRESQTDLPSWNEVMKPDKGCVQMPHPQLPVPLEQGASTEGPGVEYLTFDEVYSDGLSLNDLSAAGADGESFWQFSSATGDLSATENSFPQNDGSLEAAIGYPLLKTQSSNLSDILKDSFKKTDSFTRWMSKELPEVEDSQIQSSSGAYWNTEEADSIIEASSREPLDQFTVAPTLSQDQLFSIVDFSPSWAYTGSKTKVLVTGRFFTNQVTERCKWSCMFGEVEVPAEISADGTLHCYSPPHKPGRVPFYITCSNRLACSEVREFEFQPSPSQFMDAPSPYGATNKVYFQIRLDKLLSLGPDEYQATISNPSPEIIDLSKKISSLMTNNDEWSTLLKLADDNELLTTDQQDQFAENLIKEKLLVWLLHKVGDGGKGPSVLDDEGQGVLHLAAALGYDWAIRPTVTAGVNINFRDVHGWTALHWAAFCGRERTVVALIALGAAPGALTDPTPDFPSGITPADLASANGHKGISGFLAESSLTSHLQALNLKWNEKIIRGLMKLPPNRKCINCNSVGPQYVCTNFWTFICLSCSGIHREFTHRVKSVSMAKFTTQEVRALEQGGNQRARDIYLKDWDWQRMRLPDNSNPDRIREFIRAVYVDKKYAGGRSTNKSATDSEGAKSNESDMRRPSSYHSYSQSPPYDFQYEDRRYGKQVDTLARRPSDRALFDRKLGSLLYSPGRLPDQMHEDQFANESSGSRFSDFSASSPGDFRNDVLSPSSQGTGYSSPSVHHSRNVSTENPQSHRHPKAASQVDFNGVRRSQRTASSGSLGSFDGSSASNKSIDSGRLPDAPTERPVHSAVNRQAEASPVAHSTQPYSSQSCTNSSVSQTALTQESVQHGEVHMASMVPLSVSAHPQPTATTQDLFDQSTMQQPVNYAASIDLFAGFNQQTPSVSHETVGLGSQSDVAKETAHNVVVQKAVTPSSSVPAEALTTSHPVHQDLFSLSISEEPATSSSPPSMDLFSGFDQLLPPTSSVQLITPAAPLPANEGWAFFDTPQHGSLTSVSNVQAQVPAAFPSSDGITKGIDQSTLPTSPPNAIMPQSSPPTMDEWSLNAEEVKIPVSNENSQAWNAFGESTGSMPNNLFTFNTMSQVAPHRFTIPSVPYVGSRTPQDFARCEPERSTSGDVFPGFNVSPGDMAGLSFPAPLQPQLGGMVSQPGKSTNPFDMAFESDVEANMFMDLTSLQATLPDPHIPTEYSGNLTESWISQNSTMSYIPSGSHGGLSYMAGQVQDSHMLNSTHQGPRNPFE